MASASKTPNLNLPQWVGTEKLERTDFNAAFDAIDTTVASHLADYATHEHDGNDTPKIQWTNVSDRPTLPVITADIEVPAGSTHNFGVLASSSVYFVAASRYSAGAVLWVILPGPKSVFKIYGDGEQGVAAFSGSDFTYKAHSGGGEAVRIVRLS